jgi:hypothetical protein
MNHAGSRLADIIPGCALADCPDSIVRLHADSARGRHARK